jgi:hypothetical protein
LLAGRNGLMEIFKTLLSPSWTLWCAKLKDSVLEIRYLALFSMTLTGSWVLCASLLHRAIGICSSFILTYQFLFCVLKERQTTNRVSYTGYALLNCVSFIVVVLDTVHCASCAVCCLTAFFSEYSGVRKGRRDRWFQIYFPFSCKIVNI